MYPRILDGLGGKPAPEEGDGSFCYLYPGPRSTGFIVIQGAPEFSPMEWNPDYGLYANPIP